MLRSAVIARTATLWPYASVPYSQSARWHGGYRQDCSGFVSGLWALPMDGPGSWGGYNTVDLVTMGLMVEIQPSQLLPGDAVGICGPNTGGNDGHITLFEKWYNDIPGDDRYWMWEQAGGTNGPRRRLVSYPWAPYKSWRLKTIQNDGGPWLRRPWPSYVPQSEYFGLITGPNESHGGYYAIERPDVKAIQQRLITLGFVPGITNPLSNWADGIYEQPTYTAVAAWQRKLYAPLTTRYGEVWSDDWSRLFTY